MRVATVVGARPQFIKSAPVSKALAGAGVDEFAIHTGQHYDFGLSQLFYEQLELEAPDANLEIGSGSHGEQTGRMLIAVEEALVGAAPDLVLVYGDTNSTLAGALAAAKLDLPVAHVEAGLRSFNRSMPEEHNRVLTDHCSSLCFCPTRTAVENLAREGIRDGVHQVGDTMYDLSLELAAVARERTRVTAELGLEAGRFTVATIHRGYNTDSDEALRAIVTALAEIEEPVVFPVHPRTRKRLDQLGLDELLRSPSSQVRPVEPLGYLEMLSLLQSARRVVTDSGGLQKEAYFFAVPCVTVRPETEWVETVEAGWNRLVGADRQAIAEAVRADPPEGAPPPLFGDGDAARRIASILSSGAR